MFYNIKNHYYYYYYEKKIFFFIGEYDLLSNIQ